MYLYIYEYIHIYDCSFQCSELEHETPRTQDLTKEPTEVCASKKEQHTYREIRSEL